MNIIVLNNRQVKLLELILLSSGRHQTLNELAREGRIRASSKTLKNDFTEIQRFAAGFDVNIKLNNKTVEFEMNGNVRKLSQAMVMLYRNSNILYVDDREMFIALDCLTADSIPSQQEWCDRFNVSRPCIQKDVGSVKKWLQRYGLDLDFRPGKGYYLIGEESRIRNALVAFVLEHIGADLSSIVRQYENSTYYRLLLERIFGSVRLEDLAGTVDAFFEENSSDDNVRQLVGLYIGIMLNRIAEEHPIEKEIVQKDEQFTYFVLILQLCETIEKEWGIVLGDAEFEGLQAVYRMAGESRISAESRSRELEDLLFDEITHSAELLFGLPYSENQSFYQSFTRIVEQLAEKNPGDRMSPIALSDAELKAFSESYPAEYALGERMIQLFRQILGITITPGEAAAVSVLLASYYEEMISANKKRVLLIGSEDQSHSTRLQYWQIMNRLSFLIQSLDTADTEGLDDVLASSDYDLVVSSEKLPRLKNLVVVPKVLRDEDIRKLRLQLSDYRFATQKPVSELGSIQVEAFYDASSRDYPSLFQKIGDFMFQRGHVPDGAEYVRKVTEHEKMFGSGIKMAHTIAIPHAALNDVSESSLALVVTARPIKVQAVGSDRMVSSRVFLFPIIARKDKDAGMIFYSILTKLRDREISSLLLKCRSSEMIKTVVDEYIRTIAD